MANVSSAKSNRVSNVRAHRQRQQEAGLRQANIWVPQGLHDWVGDQVKAGKFRNKSEAFIEGLKMLAETETHETT